MERLPASLLNVAVTNWAPSATVGVGFGDRPARSPCFSLPSRSCRAWGHGGWAVASDRPADRARTLGRCACEAEKADAASFTTPVSRSTSRTRRDGWSECALVVSPDGRPAAFVGSPPSRPRSNVVASASRPCRVRCTAWTTSGGIMSVMRGMSKDLSARPIARPLRGGPVKCRLGWGDQRWSMVTVNASGPIMRRAQPDSPEAHRARRQRRWPCGPVRV